MQQVCLAKSDAPIKKQWIVRLPRSLCNCEGSGVCQAIAVTDNKGLEGIARVEAGIYQKVCEPLIVPFFLMVGRSRGPQLEVLPVNLYCGFRRENKII